VSHNNASLRQQRFRSIIDENRDRMGRIARVYAGGDAEDLVQEILMQVWRSLPDYDQHAKLSTWSYRIALNTAISWRRRVTRAKRKPPDNRVTTDTLSSNLSFSNEAVLLERFLNSLSEIDRAVLLMFLDNLTHQEIAESIGVSDGAIRTRLIRRPVDDRRQRNLETQFGAIPSRSRRKNRADRTAGLMVTAIRGPAASPAKMVELGRDRKPMSLI
jgi:RNA polymerase sigma factor (sigma-70 family)